MDKHESEFLNKNLDWYTNPDIKINLENLKWLWIDTELFTQFERRIMSIIWENPWSECLIVSELWKTQISLENLLDNYNRKFRSIINYTANNDFFEDVA